jgi:DinB superfamily/Pentapeptide repeats (8 copies)
MGRTFRGMTNHSSPAGDLRSVEFAGTDMCGAQFRRVDLRHAWFREVDLRGVRMRGVALIDADLDGEMDRLRIWGVEVAPLVEAELDRRHPERAVLQATEPADLQGGCAGLEAMWAATVERVAGMPVGTQDVSVAGEWSFAQTLRHLVLATDAWLGKAILRRERPFHPLGVLFSEAVGHEAEFGIDADATPSWETVLEVRAGRVAMVREYLATVSPVELAGERPDPWGGDWEPSVLQCLRVIFQEEWHHHRYAVRDLGTIDAGRA